MTPWNNKCPMLEQIICHGVHFVKVHNSNTQRAINNRQNREAASQINYGEWDLKSN